MGEIDCENSMIEGDEMNYTRNQQVLLKDIKMSSRKASLIQKVFKVARRIHEDGIPK